MTEPVICPNCGTPHYPDERARKKCDCGTWVWFDSELKQRFGSDPPSRAFTADPHKWDSLHVGEDDDQDQGNQTRLSDY